ncbi:hypothetical protein [Coleofasciculus sp. C1-SOL-03]|uniref:hypothetical protein n=1 Tax=Coleofasciculus sp. C1-SOL-03 TaxID=3069522 RepID=UPI00406446F4
MQQKLDQSAFVGYNGLNVPVNVPQTPPPQPVQEKSTDAGLEDKAQQPEISEAEATESQEEETVQRQEGSEAELSQNPESPEKEVDGEAVTSSEPSAAESENNPSQKPNLQAQKEKVSRSSSNLLNIPVKAPGKEPPSTPEAEATSEQGEETIQREEVPEENVSQNPESADTEVEGEAVTPAQPSAAESENNPSQKPNLQAQKERASRLSSNLLNIPVNTQGKESPPVQRKVLQDGLEQYHPKIEQRTHSVFNGLNRFNVQPSSQPETVQPKESSSEEKLQQLSEGESLKKQPLPDAEVESSGAFGWESIDNNKQGNPFLEAEAGVEPPQAKKLSNELPDIPPNKNLIQPLREEETADEMAQEKPNQKQSAPAPPKAQPEEAQQAQTPATRDSGVTETSTVVTKIDSQTTTEATELQGGTQQTTSASPASSTPNEGSAKAPVSLPEQPNAEAVVSQSTGRATPQSNGAAVKQAAQPQSDLGNLGGFSGASLDNAFTADATSTTEAGAEQSGVGIDALLPIVDQVFNQFIGSSNAEFDQKVADIEILAQDTLAQIESAAQTLISQLTSAFAEGRTTVTEAFAQSRTEVEQSKTSAKGKLTQSVDAAHQKVDAKKETSDTQVDTAVEQTTSQLQSQVEAVRAETNATNAQTDLQSRAQAVKSRYAGKDAQAEVNSAVDDVANRSTSELQSQSGVAATNLDGVEPEAVQRWQTEGQTAHQQIETTVQSAKTAIEQGKSEAEQGIETKVAEQLASFDTAEAESLSKLDTQEAEQVAEAQAKGNVARQGLEQNKESQRQELEKGRNQTTTSTENARAEVAALLEENPDASVDPVAFRAALENATDGQLESLKATLDGSQAQVQGGWQQEADNFTSQSAAAGSDATTQVNEGANTTKVTLQGQVTHIEGNLNNVATNTGQKIVGVGEQSATAMDQTVQQMQGGLQQGLSNVTDSLNEGQAAFQTSKDRGVSQASNSMEQAAQEADKSWWEEALSAIGSFLSDLWDGIVGVFEAIGDALLWVGKQLVNLVWGFIWGEVVFDDVWGAEVVAFIGDFIAGVLIIGDIRDIVKWGFIKPVLFGEGYSTENWLMIGIAAFGLIPLIGDAGKVVKGIKALLKGGAKQIAQELAEKLGKEIADRLLKEFTEEVAERLLKELGPELLKDLVEQLGERTLKELVEQFGEAGVKELAETLGVNGLKELIDKLTVNGLKELVDAFTIAGVKELTETFTVATLKELVTSFGAQGLKQAWNAVGKATFSEMVSEFGATALKTAWDEIGEQGIKILTKDLAASTIKKLYDDLGGLALKNLTDGLSGNQIFELVRNHGLDTNYLKSLAEVTGSGRSLARAITHFGSAGDLAKVLLKAHTSTMSATVLKEFLEACYTTGFKQIGEIEKFFDYVIKHGGLSDDIWRSAIEWGQNFVRESVGNTAKYGGRTVSDASAPVQRTLQLADGSTVTVTLNNDDVLHMASRHTWEFFAMVMSNVKPSNSMWPLGTKQADVFNMATDALNSAEVEALVRTMMSGDNQIVEVTVNGLRHEARIALNGPNGLVSLYPLAGGAGVAEVPKNLMKAAISLWKSL